MVVLTNKCQKLYFLLIFYILFLKSGLVKTEKLALKEMEEAEKKSRSSLSNDSRIREKGETYKHNSYELENDVVTLLEKLNLSQLHDVFERSEVTMEDLETFNDQDLDCIGVRKYAHKKKILNAVKGKSQETHQPSKYQKSSKPSKTVENRKQSSYSPDVQPQEKLSSERLTGHLEDEELLLITSSGPAAEWRGKYQYGGHVTSLSN